MENPPQRQAPTWQRAVAALLAVGGLLALTSTVFAGTREWDWQSILVCAGALWGLYLFGFFALKGTLPGKLGHQKRR